jgi:hypothetical protein
VHYELPCGALVEHHVTPAQGALDWAEKNGVAMVNEKRSHAAARDKKAHIVALFHQFAQC